MAARDCPERLEPDRHGGFEDATGAGGVARDRRSGIRKGEQGYLVGKLV
jgi:hypothetical protein